MVAALAAAMTSPADFAEYYGRGNFHRTRHQTLISDAIADAVFAQQLSILIVECPPQHGKSAIVSQWAPAWFVSMFPERNVGLASYEAGVALRWSRWVRDTIRENGTTQLKGDSTAADEWMTSAGGGMLAVGVGGPLTSYSIHLMVIDDPIKNAEEADSETMRAKIWDWFQTVAWTRKQPGTVFVIMHTRWHEDDLVGRILAQPEMAKLVRRINLPALAEANDPLGRKLDEALWPERYPADDSPDGLFTTRAIIDPRWWNALYQQRPASAEGNEIERSWWKYYTELPVPWEHLEYRIGSWDGTFTNTSTSDYVVGQVWGVYGSGRYLLDKIRKRMNFVEACEAVAAMHTKWQCHGTAVELAANGHAIVSSLQIAMPGVYGVKVGNNGKVARARAQTPQLKAGNIYLPKSAPMSAELVEECAAFPYGKNDDDVDAWSQAMSELAPFVNVPVTHLKSGDDRFVPPHIRDLQQKGVLGGLGTMPRSWKI